MLWQEVIWVAIHNCNSMTNEVLLSQTGTSVEGHLDSITESRQPYLLAVETQGVPYTNTSLWLTNVHSCVSHQTLLTLFQQAFLKLFLSSLPHTTRIWPMSTTFCKSHFTRLMLLPPSSIPGSKKWVLGCCADFYFVFIFIFLHWFLKFEKIYFEVSDAALNFNTEKYIVIWVLWWCTDLILRCFILFANALRPMPTH